MFKYFKNAAENKIAFKAKEIINHMHNVALCEESNDNGILYDLILKENLFGESSLRKCEKEHLDGTTSSENLVEMQKKEPAPTSESEEESITQKPSEEEKQENKSDSEAKEEAKEDSAEVEKKNVIEAEVNSDNVNVGSAPSSTIKDEERDPVIGSEEVDLTAIMRNNPILGVDATPNIENTSDESESAPDVKTPIANIDSFKYASDYIDAYACAISNCIRAFTANSEAGMNILNEVVAFSSNLKNYIYGRYFYDGTNAFENLPPINNIEDMKILSNVFARSICNAHKSMRNTLYEQSDFERYIYDVVGSIA